MLPDRSLFKNLHAIEYRHPKKQEAKQLILKFPEKTIDNNLCNECLEFHPAPIATIVSKTNQPDETNSRPLTS